MAANTGFALLFEILLLKHLKDLMTFVCSLLLTPGMYRHSVGCTLGTQMVRISKPTFLYISQPWQLRECTLCRLEKWTLCFCGQQHWWWRVEGKTTLGCFQLIDFHYAINRWKPLPSVHPVDISSTPVITYTFPFQDEVALLLSMIAWMTIHCCGNFR